ncbi:MAG: cysteine--tRNA ligase [Candidatus Kerfeldbacteria bacterium]|nr:cysteine--tRNA ligase [Candidatus Kerfeldbacteria bacterium]
MTLQLFNTMSRQKEVFTPLAPPSVSLYTCGLTVYDYAHIGNLRAFIFEDVLRRVFVANGYTVKHVQNITDVGHLTDDGDSGEDKMEKGAAREGKTAWDIAKFFTAAFREDAAALHIVLPALMPKATEHIPEQIALIEQLEKKDFTYRIDDGIYFDTSKLTDYGKLAQLDIAGLQEGARVEKNVQKKNATDFALWKFSPAGVRRDMEWNSPWGVGFPGWHIECSAMAMKYLGETIDVHAGGVDHIAVHHTNEIAQSEAVTGKPFARVWMHGEFLLVDGQKMSKSKQNFYRVTDIIEHGFDPLAYRYLLLGAHYRSKLNFTWAALKGAQQAYDKLITLCAGWEEGGSVLEEFRVQFLAALNDDLNTPQALAVLWEMVKSSAEPADKKTTLLAMDELLGLSLFSKAEALRTHLAELGGKMEVLIREREEARAEKNYERADALRAEILHMGIQVEDSAEGPILKLARA